MKNNQSYFVSFSFIWQVFIEIVYIIYPKAPFILLKRPPPDLGFLVVVVVALGLAAGLAELSLHLPVPVKREDLCVSNHQHSWLLYPDLHQNQNFCFGTKLKICFSKNSAKNILLK